MTTPTHASSGRTALLAIDCQRDFLADDGRLPVARDQVPGLIATVNEAIETARERGDLVLHVVNRFPRGSVANLFRRFAAIEGQPGAALDPRVDGDGVEQVPKSRSDAFTNPALAETLRAAGVDHVVLAGVFANHCVLATARGAVRQGFRVSVLAGGVAAASARAREKAIAAYEKLGATVVHAAEAA